MSHRTEMNFRTATIVTLIALCLLPVGSNRSVFGQEAPKKIPVRVKADKLDYDKTTDVSIAEGHVQIEQEGVLLDADKVTLDNKTGNVVAEGNVYFQQQGEILRADRLEININTKAGSIQKGEIFIVKDNYHMKGAAIEKRSDTVFRIEDGTMTTCDENDWYLKAQEIDVDMDRYATASHVSFNMGGLPLFYTPYLLFPVRRQTGLLIPEVGVSSSEGFLAKESFFWAISDFQDLTLTLDYRRNHGLGTGLEYRYVNSRDSAGKLSYNYFDVFPSSGSLARNLWELKYQHREEISEDLSFHADIKQVSDFFYYREIEKKLELRSQPYLDSNAFFVARGDSSVLSLIGQYSTDLTQTNTKTAQKLPELRYVIFPEKLPGPLYLSFDGSGVNYTVRDGYGTRRASLDPQVTLALSGGGLSFTPRVGVRGVYYDRSATNTWQSTDIQYVYGGQQLHFIEWTRGPKSTDIQYVYGGADFNARISRVYGTDEGEGIGRIRHSIEPTLSYDYVPRVDNAAEAPQFDSLDAVSRRNLLKFSLINRLTAHYCEGNKTRNYDMMIFTVSQSYDYLEARNGNSATAQPRSEIQSEFIFNTPKVFTLSASGNYNTYINHWTTSSESMNYRGEMLRVNLTHQYLRETAATKRTEYLTGGTGVKFGGWDLYAGIWYDLDNRLTTQKEYRITRLSQCWGIGFSYITKPGETQYLFSLELKGLGTVKF